MPSVATPKPPSSTRLQPLARSALQIAGFEGEEGDAIRALDVEEAEKGLQSQLLGVGLEVDVVEDFEEAGVVGEDKEGVAVPGGGDLGVAGDVVWVL